MLEIDQNLLTCEPFEFEFGKGVTVLAVGAELKSSICLIHDGLIYLGKPGPGLIEADAYRDFVSKIQLFLSSLPKNPDLIVCDLHPGYSSTSYAKSLGLPLLQIQHHYAHIIACMVENGLNPPVLGIAADGTGYGTDGAIWGCELLKADFAGFDRLGHLKYFKLFGGDSASTETWRPAAGLMTETFGKDFLLKDIDNEVLGIAKTKILSGSGVVNTSSLGRLFDGVSFLLGLCEKNQTEAQAAIALENAASRAKKSQNLRFEIIEAGNGCIGLDFRPLIKNIIELRDQGEEIASIALSFHETLAKMLTDSVNILSQKTKIRNITLSGGCFLNKILTKEIEYKADRTLNLYKHKLTAPGDDCIAFGQACIGSWRIINNQLES